jgi:hypothetical protein
MVRIEIKGAFQTLLPNRAKPTPRSRALTNNASWALERFLKGHIDAALTISNAVERKPEVPGKGYVRQQLLQFLFVTREAH